jgi:hypothetical protein
VAQRHYSKATTNVNDELEKGFPTQDVMDALGVPHINIGLNKLQKKHSWCTWHY